MIKKIINFFKKIFSQNELVADLNAKLEDAYFEIANMEQTVLERNEEIVKLSAKVYELNNQIKSLNTLIESLHKSVENYNKLKTLVGTEELTELIEKSNLLK